MKNKIVIAAIILVGLFISYFYISDNQGLDLKEKRSLVETYLKENISSLSPEKEVLGGKFYVTKIDWIGNNEGKVEYEDGHILLNANFEYQISSDKNAVIIDKFEITK